LIIPGFVVAELLFRVLYIAVSIGLKQFTVSAQLLDVRYSKSRITKLVQGDLNTGIVLHSNGPFYFGTEQTTGTDLLINGKTVNIKKPDKIVWFSNG
jgi:hypothetical protein